jgi:GT2 family glycosyltransferase/glycosyltransferase involved in cell wall biosynthesis
LKKADSDFGVSIIIPVFNKVEYTEKCLDAIARNTSVERYEVVIVDNGSTDGTKDFLERLDGDVKVITNRSNHGFARACNQGATASEGKYLLFLNNDTVPKEGWLGAMIDAVRSEPDIGIVGSKLVYPDGAIQHAGVVFHRRNGVIIHIYKGFNGDHPGVNYLRDYNAVTGACLLIPKDLFSNLDGFCEEFIAGYEDLDLCLRAKTEGYRVVYQPKSELVHFEEVTRQELPSHGIADSQLLLKRNPLPDDAEEKAKEDGYALKLLEGGQIGYVPLVAGVPAEDEKQRRPREDRQRKVRGSHGGKRPKKEHQKKRSDRIAIIRGPKLNKWEMQNYEPLCEEFEITAYGTTSNDFDIAKIDIPIIQLPSEPDNPACMIGLEEHLADKDIIYTADITWGFSLQAINVKEKYGNKVVCLEWENIPFGYENYETIRTIKGRVIDRADHFIAVTRRAKEALLLEGVPEERIDIIPMGIDVKRFTPRIDEKNEDRKDIGLGVEDILILFIGRLVWEKGIYDLVHAARMVLGDPSISKLPVKFLVVGKGPELVGVRDRVIRLGISDRFKFIIEYPYEKMHRLHNLTDIFVLPSISTRDWQEQFGMVLVESMACGKPVVSTLSGSIPEVVGDAGVLVQPHDPLTLSNALKNLILDRDRREDLGKMARTRAVDKFNSEKVANAVKGVFERLLARNELEEGFQGIYDEGVNLWNQERKEEGFHKIYEVFQENPQDRRFLEILVKMASDLDRAEVGERCLRAYLKLHPANIEVLLLMANNLISQGKLDEAQEEIEKVTLFDPGNKEALGLKKQTVNG